MMLRQKKEQKMIETWHDQIPTHPSIPPEIARLEIKLDEAIARADELLERWMSDHTGAILFSEVEEANERILLVQDALFYLRELRDGNDCTCTPIGDACRFCQLYNRYKEYLEIEKEGIE
jgi:hypothetical protein